MHTLPTIPGYRLGEELGRGAIGAVYAARHEATGTEVAIKVVLPDGPRARVALHNEVLAMARLNHPNLLFLYDTGVVEGPLPLVWLAVEKASGGSLEHWRPTSWAEIEGVLDPLLSGLAHAHAHGVVHRDLKPANLLLATAEDHRPGLKIADFGLTAVRGVGTVYRRGGTPLYMPPEQARTDRGEPGPWSDIYTLGAILWRWVCAAAPFRSGTTEQLMRAHTSAPLPSFKPVFEVPAALRDTLTHMLRKAPGQRPQSIAEVRRALSHRTRTAEQTFRQSDTGAASARLPGIGAELIPLRDWRLVGRTSERQRLAESLDAVLTAGTPSVCLISGAPGVGKTRLMRWLAETAAEAGIAHLEWAPADTGLVLARASQGPVVACFDDLDASSEARVAALSFARAPILILATCRNPQEWPDLDVLPGFRHLPLPAMDPKSFRRFLSSELGIASRHSVRMDRACEYIPGVATAWLARLSREGALTPGPDGYEISEAQIDRGPDLERPIDEALTSLLATMPTPQLDGLRVAALCGEVVSADLLNAALQRMNREPPRAALEQLARAGWIVPVPDGFRWVDGLVRERLLLPGGTPEEHLAISEFLALDPSPDTPLNRARHLLQAGHIAAALALLLVHESQPTAANQERLRESVELARPHVASASPTQQACFLLMELRVLLNLVSEQAARPAAEALLAAVGTPGSPGTLGEGVSEALRQESLEFVALVFAFGGLGDRVRAVIATLPETPTTLRALGLVLSDEGDLEGGLAIQERAMAMTNDLNLQARLANGIGSAHGLAGRHEQAINWFSVSVELLPAGLRHIPIQNIALSLLALDRPMEALEYTREAYSLDHVGGAAHSTRGAELYALSAALADSDPDVELIMDHAIYLLRRHGSTVPLVEIHEHIRNAQPKNPASRAYLATMRAILAAAPEEPSR